MTTFSERYMYKWRKYKQCIRNAKDYFNTIFRVHTSTLARSLLNCKLAVCRCDVQDVNRFLLICWSKYPTKMTVLTMMESYNFWSGCISFCNVINIAVLYTVYQYIDLPAYAMNAEERRTSPTMVDIWLLNVSLLDSHLCFSSSKLFNKAILLST